MLVINGERDTLPPTEKAVLEWLNTWNGEHVIPGVAISGVHIPAQGGKTSEADLVVITPQACVVVEVKGVTAPVSGELTCTANGPWTLPGLTGDAVYVRGSDINPINQIREATFGLKNLAKQADLDAFVSGLVMVVAHTGCTVTVVKKDMPRGIDVLGNLYDLRAWFTSAARRKTHWTADRAHKLIASLHFDHAVGFAELVDEGFVAETSLHAVPLPPTIPIGRSPKPVAAPPAQRSDVDTPPTEQPEPAPQPIVEASPAQNVPDEPLVRSTDEPAAPTRRRRVIDGEKIAALAVVGLLVTGIWLLADRDSGRDTTPVQRPEVTEPAGAPPAPEPVVAPPPAPERPQPPAQCFPFQANC